jgi:regulator of sigma E protease
MFVFYIYAGILLGILIIVHEVGHFIAARASGVVVERFSIGFGPRILTVRRGETEYALSAVPLGGYVKMAGTDVSEHPTGEPAAPGSFPGKPAGIRALIVASGPVSNFIWAILVFIGVVWATGVPTFGNDPVIGLVEPDSPAQAAGLLPLDRVVSVGGESVRTWDDLRSLVAAADTTRPVGMVVERGPGETRVTLSVRPRRDPETGTPVIGVGTYIPPLIGDVMRESPADRAGLEKGDRVTSVQDQSVETWYQLQDIISKSAGDTLTIRWERDGHDYSANVVPEEVTEPVGETEVAKVGSIGTTVPLAMRPVGPWEAVVSGARASISTLDQIVRTFWWIATRRISFDLVGGPIRVVQMASESARWGVSYFFAFMAFLSLNLAVINLLPLPVLDGGHLLLLAIERIRGRALSPKALIVWQQIGLFFFMALVVFLLVRDALLLR